jgi:hypothetical protein
MLEQPIPESQYVAKVRDKALLKQGRHTDKPEFDLRIDRNNCLERGLIVEFAYFRKTEISENQDKSGRHGKIFNEIHRLALLNHFRNEENNSYYNDFTNYDCLLICITDDEMINYGHNSRGRMAIPVQNRYELTEEYLSNFPDTVKNSINAIFKQKVKELKIIPTAKRIFEKNEEKNGETPQWATWIWKVSYKRNH